MPHPSVLPFVMVSLSLETPVTSVSVVGFLPHFPRDPGSPAPILEVVEAGEDALFPLLLRLSQLALHHLLGVSCASSVQELMLSCLRGWMSSDLQDPSHPKHPPQEQLAAPLHSSTP